MRTKKPKGRTITFSGFLWKPFSKAAPGVDALILYGQMWEPAETNPARVEMALRV
ncbi:hypothetical protein ACMT9U_09835 [Clavibacter sp. Sh2036]|uniref:hypothetical protein n=1 Tax=Clavibacter sp. Sh2036 TaxID=3397677 RepID=UPI0039DFD7FF